MRKMKEFSKKIVVAMTLLWFLTAFFAIFIVSFEPTMLESLLSFVGLPVSSAIVSYLVKSAFENREKIKNERNKDFAETHFTDK